MKNLQIVSPNDRVASGKRRNLSVWLLVTAVLLLFLAACGGGEDEPTDEPRAEPATSEVEEEAEEPEDVAEEEAAADAEPTAVPAVAETEIEAPEPTVEPTAVPPARVIEAGEYVYSNGNIVRDVAVLDNTVWAASTGGLVRFDLASGETRKYTTLDGLPNIGTFALEVCPIGGEDRLIVGTRDGLVVYNAASDSWDSGDTIGFGDTDTAIHEMRCDAVNGRLVLEYDDVSVLDLASQTMTHYTEDDDGLAWFAVEQLIVLGDDIWTPTDFQGISRIGLDGTVETWNEEVGFPDDDVSDIAVDGSGAYWLGMSSGLLKWENGSYTLLDRDTHPDIISYFGPQHVETAADGTLWLGFNAELCNFDPVTQTCVQTVNMQNDLGFPVFASLARLEVLPDGRILVQSYNDGVAYYDGSAWTRLALDNQAPDNYFDGLAQTSDGTIWAYGDGLYSTDVTAASWEIFPDFYPNDLVEAANGDIWMVSSYSVAQYNGAQLFTWDDEAGLLDTTYNRLAVTGQGVVYAVGYDGYSIIDGETITAVGAAEGWDLGNIRDVLVVGDVVYAATINGLVTLDGPSWTVLLDETYVNLPAANIGALASLSDGTLLLGTTRGLATYQDGTVTAVPDVTGSISDIFVTPDDQIHLVSFPNGQPGGYFHYDGSSWNFRPDTDFPMTSLRAVLVDSENTVWIALGDTGLGGGLYRIAP